MNSKHRKTLEAIFSDPVNGGLESARIEALFVALGCQILEGSGSSVTFEKGGKRAHLHRPHPQRESLRYRVRAVREYLTTLGVKP
ncbi:MAG: type II toxin-antitoxin system HicA family toxin [Proteobacteria bacterium]|nr:type II toxin-antitoxin system HicA family toxin [Pseudomonadota bacterium]